MKPNKKYFCNIPWFGLHLYWDGGFGICCVEKRRLYNPLGSDEKLETSDAKYNIKNMSMKEWYNSDPVKQLRKDMYADTGTDVCSKCYHLEDIISTSKRVRENQKSAIFTKSAFDESFEQSPHNLIFKTSSENDWQTDLLPCDFHVDFGNYCNLGCKMCYSALSSTIAAHEVKMGNQKARKFLGNDWTKDPVSWQSFLDQFLDLPISNLHFMGGETLITPRFHEFVDKMLEMKKTNFGIQFVTNGTIYDPALISKLTKFDRVGIEISIETLHHDINTYIRQGTNTQQVLDNIQKYITLAKDYANIDIVIRPALSLLSVGTYVSLLEYAYINKLMIKSTLVVRPEFLQANILPSHVKTQYIKKYKLFLEKYDLPDFDRYEDFNESNPHEYKRIIAMEVQSALNFINSEVPDNVSSLSKQFANHCNKWDQVYKYNARHLYPEFIDWMVENGYNL